MAAEIKTGMEKAEMKALLNKVSPNSSMSFAFGADKKQAAVGLLVMHKTKNPKACQQLLLDDFPDAFNLRFGTLTIDANNPKQVNFTVNKAISSFAKRLTKTLKGTGFTLVQIQLEDGTSVESASDEETVAGAGGAAAPASGATESGDTSPDDSVAKPDAAAMTKDLGELVRQIKTVAGADAALLAKMMKFATDANVNIKTNNLTYAAVAISQLRAAIATGPAQQTASTGTEAPTTDDPGTGTATGFDPALQSEWDAAWASADPLVQTAIRVPGADAGKLRAVRDFVLGKAEAGDFKAAHKSLATLLGLVGAAPKPTQNPTESATGPDVSAVAEATDGPQPDGLVNPDQNPAADPKFAKLAAGVEQLRGQVGALPGSDGADAMTAILDKAAAAIAAGEAETALSGLKRVQDGLKLQAEVDRLAPLVAAAASSGQVADVNALNLLFNWVAGKIPATDHAKAMGGLAKVEAMLAAGAAQDKTAFEQDQPLEIRPYATARLNWSFTRDKLRTEIGRLEASIIKTLADEGINDQQPIDGKLFAYVEKLDARLEVKLNEIVNSDAGDQRESLKKEARSLIAEYRKELDTDFFKDVDDNNGFTPVAITSTARDMLNNLSEVLAA